MKPEVLKLEGRLDSAAAANLEAKFVAETAAVSGRSNKAIIDLQELVYISSRGIRILLTAIKQLHKNGVAFATVRPRDRTAHELLIDVDLASYLNMVEDDQAAHSELYKTADF